MSENSNYPFTKEELDTLLAVNHTWDKFLELDNNNYSSDEEELFKKTVMIQQSIISKIAIRRQFPDLYKPEKEKE